MAEKKTLKYVLWGGLALILFIIFTPIFYMALFFSITFLIYSKFNKKLNKKVVFLDSALIHSLIIIPITLILASFYLPNLVFYLFDRSIEYQYFTWHIWFYLFKIFGFFLVDAYSFIIRMMLSVGALMVSFGIINIINSVKNREYLWLFIMLFLPFFQIIYYFSIGRENMKK